MGRVAVGPVAEGWLGRRSKEVTAELLPSSFTLTRKVVGLDQSEVGWTRQRSTRARNPWERGVWESRGTSGTARRCRSARKVERGLGGETPGLSKGVDQSAVVGASGTGTGGCRCRLPGKRDDGGAVAGAHARERDDLEEEAGDSSALEGRAGASSSEEGGREELIVVGGCAWSPRPCSFLWLATCRAPVAPIRGSGSRSLEGAGRPSRRTRARRDATAVPADPETRPRGRQDSRFRRARTFWSVRQEDVSAGARRVLGRAPDPVKRTVRFLGHRFSLLAA
jgi:hypothetical protein